MRRTAGKTPLLQPAVHPAALAVDVSASHAGAGALLDELARWTVEALGADVGAIYLVDRQRRALAPAVRYASPPGSDARRAAEAELAAQALTTAGPIVAPSGEAGLLSRNGGGFSAAALPLPGEGGPLGALAVVARRDGTFDEAHLGLLRAGAQLAALAVTRAREWETAARERNALKAILFSMAEGVFSTDLEGRIVSFNPGAERLTGYRADEVIGRGYREALDLVDEAGQAVGEQNCPLRGCIAIKRPAYLPLAFVTRRDGQRVAVALSTSPILDPLGGPAWCVAILRDVSREREVEELKTNLISFVSHELRTPLSHIKGFVSALRQPDLGWDETTRREFLAEIEAEADRLNRLIANLLDMSRLQSGGLDAAERRPIAPVTLVRAAVGQLARELSGRRVVVRVPADLPPVVVDPGQMERVFANLLENAAKYSQPGGSIRLGGRVRDGWVELWVADEGPGIPAEHLERIFEKFYRVRDGAAQRAPGTGLGLALCRAVVAAHGGTIHAESHPDQGARFVVRLPVAPPVTPCESGG